MTDDWRPRAGLAQLRARAGLLAQIRAFFEARGVWEVQTPLLSAGASTDPHLHSLSSDVRALGRRLYWQTSPEFAMKRLLAAGSGAIYQICPVFRDEERGRLHNPEFTLLEWYRPGWDEWRLMEEVDDLLRCVCTGRRTLAPAHHVSYAQAFLRHAGLDPHTAQPADCRQVLQAHDLSWPDGLPEARDIWLDLLMSHLVGPRLGRQGPCFVYDYPASQAALARLKPGQPAVAARFELYLDGIELANGFHELADADEQRRRFEADNRARAAQGLPQIPLDQHLLAALAHGLPDCAGVAVGVDRLIMLALGCERLDEVLAFSIERA